tara:strand:- start:16 stop:2364 length:2349 start_codon:yes stop_codon:yes gene_type:complete
MILSDFGAEVIKVERPGGDPFRSQPSAPMWLRGKQSVQLNLKSAAAVARLHELVQLCDVVVVNHLEATAKKLHCDYDSLNALNPRLIYCRITGFGQKGPYAHLPAYEGVVAAKAGRMKGMEGIGPAPGPAYSGVQVATHAAAQSAASGILAALLERRKTGTGQAIHTSLLQGLMPYDQGGLMALQLRQRRPKTDARPRRRYDPYKVMPTLNYHPVQTKDGRWIQLGNLLPHLYMNFYRVAGLDDFLDSEAYDATTANWSNEDREEFRNSMLQRMQERTAAEWMSLFIEDGGVVAHTYQTTEESLQDPDIVANGHAVEMDGIKQLGPLANLTQTPGAIAGPAPRLGQHDDSAQFSLAVSSQQTAIDAGSTKPPLDGVTVLEFATIIAAPMGASFLGDMGARVIKVELIGGDPIRGMGPGIGASRVNNSKESISIDLKSTEGQAIAHGLMEKADIIIHNYRPGVPERLGIGYADAKRIKKDIVYLSANGYGPKGPGAKRPSTHPIPGAALGGAAYQAGGIANRGLLDLDELRETCRKLFLANEVNPDPNTSMVVCTAALLGYYARESTGQGQQIFLDMFGANAYANFDDFIVYAGKPPKQPLDTELRGPHPLYRLYECQSGWIFLGLPFDAEWSKFCEITGRPDLRSEPAFASQQDRNQNQDRLTDNLSRLFGTESAAHWESLLGGQGLGCVVADDQSMPEFYLNDPHARENGCMIEATHARWGEYLRYGPMVEFSRSSGSLGAAVLAGENTNSVLAELGYTEDEIIRMRENKQVWSEPIEVTR